MVREGEGFVPLEAMQPTKKEKKPYNKAQNKPGFMKKIKRAVAIGGAALTMEGAAMPTEVHGEQVAQTHKVEQGLDSEQGETKEEFENRITGHRLDIEHGETVAEFDEREATSVRALNCFEHLYDAKTDDEAVQIVKTFASQEKMSFDDAKQKLNNTSAEFGFEKFGKDGITKLAQEMRVNHGLRVLSGFAEAPLERRPTSQKTERAQGERDFTPAQEQEALHFLAKLYRARGGTKNEVQNEALAIPAASTIIAEFAYRLKTNNFNGPFGEGGFVTPDEQARAVHLLVKVRQEFQTGMLKRGEAYDPNNAGMEKLDEDLMNYRAMGK